MLDFGWISRKHPSLLCSSDPPCRADYVVQQTGTSHRQVGLEIGLFLEEQSAQGSPDPSVRLFPSTGGCSPSALSAGTVLEQCHGNTKIETTNSSGSLNHLSLDFAGRLKGMLLAGNVYVHLTWKLLFIQELILRRANQLYSRTSYRCAF